MYVTTCCIAILLRSSTISSLPTPASALSLQNDLQPTSCRSRYHSNSCICKFCSPACLFVMHLFELRSSLHFCQVNRSTSHSHVSTFVVSEDPPVSTFVVSADPPLAVLYPLLSCQQIHPSQSCLHFCRVSRSTPRSPVSTFVMSADPPLTVPSSFCHVSRFSLVSFLSSASRCPSWSIINLCYPCPLTPSASWYSYIVLSHMIYCLHIMLSTFFMSDVTTCTIHVSPLP